jgi:hypothetical protein
MKQLFALSYALLWGIVLLETMMLREILRRTVRFKRLYAAPQNRSERPQLTTGTLAPDFVSQLVGSGRIVTTADLKGHSTILLFISPSDASSPVYEKLSLGTHALWHKADGNLYLVCSGEQEACRRIMRDYHVEGFNRGRVPILLDEKGLIAASFLITGTPQAVMLDEEARVSRYGYPAADGKVTDGEH